MAAAAASARPQRPARARARGGQVACRDRRGRGGPGRLALPSEHFSEGRRLGRARYRVRVDDGRCDDESGHGDEGDGNASGGADRGHADGDDDLL
eukprot:4667124-Pyramimonas_sp.AAC.1